MLTVKPAPMPVQLLSRRTGVISAGYSQLPPRNYDGIHRRLRDIPTKSQTSEPESIGGLGKQILRLSSAESNPTEKEISGSDVLLAIQRATAQRKRSNGDKMKKKMKMMTRVEELSSSTDEYTEDNGVVNYSNVRPLKIKSNWSHRLDEFEKLLKELQETEL